MQRTWVVWIVGLGAALSLALGSPDAAADRVSDLEQRVLQLEQQNLELQTQIKALLGEVRQQQEVVEEVQETQKTVAPKQGPLANAKFGGDLRLRGVMMDNMWNFEYQDTLYDDSWEWYRMRTRLWMDSRLSDELRFYFRVANEYKWGLDRKANTLLIDPDFDSLIGNKEIFIDNAFVEWYQPFDIEQLTLKIGRQDLIYGEGFLILDGQDNVGSMAIAFDGAKASWALGDRTNLDLFAMKIQENEKNFADDEDLYGAYLTDTSLFEDHKVEAYVLHRNQNNVDDYYAAITPAGSAMRGTVLDPKQHTTALGARLSGAFFDGSLTYAAEGTYQFGEIDDATGFFFAGTDSFGEDSVDRKAFGGYAWGKYTFVDHDWKPYVKLGGVYTSGDDPDSSDYEGFDSFYAEWPKYSEGMIYQLYDPFSPLKAGTDPDLGAWANMMIAQAEVGCNPVEDMGLSLTYMHLWADEDNGLGDGDDRGDMVKGMVTYNFNEYLSGHLLGEYFWPDDYYPDDADDAFFARWELMLHF